MIFYFWLFATIGNSLGSVINYFLGRYLLHWQDRKWFPIKPQQMQKSQNWFNKYGRWSVLLAWAPIIGDAITVIAGTMKMHFGLFVALVTLVKALRYGILIAGLSLVT